MAVTVENYGDACRWWNVALLKEPQFLISCTKYTVQI